MRFVMLAVTAATLLLAAACASNSPATEGAASRAVVSVLTGGSSNPMVADAPELLGFSSHPEWGSPASPHILRTGSGATCGKGFPAGMAAGKTALRAITSGGMKRTFRVHIPSSATNGSPIPVVLNFHGRSGTGIDQEITSGLVPISDRETFVLVSPDGTGTPMGWSAGATEPNEIDDVRFVSDILDTITNELCIDSTRVYATGFSNGAFMTSRLACAMPDRIAAIAVVGGVDFPGGSCKSVVPVLAVHGTADEVVPIEGGIVRAWHYEGANAAIEDWAANNGCRPLSVESAIATGVSLDAYVDCAAPTLMVRIQDAGHIWPGGPGYQPGTPGTNISAAEMVWAFLSRGTIRV